jgi:hypothetical protein
MGFGDILVFLLRYFTYFTVWLICRILILPHIFIFPYIPPHPIWLSLYKVAISAGVALYMFSIYLMIFLFITYVILDKIIRWILFPISYIFVEIILNLTPFKEFRQLGIVDLFYDLSGIIFSTKSFTQRFVDFFKSLGRFLLVAIGLKGRIETVQKNVKVNLENKEKNEEKPYDFGGIRFQDAYKQNKYEKCFAENYKQLTDNMSSLEKIKTKVNNARVSSLCSLKQFKNINVNFEE